MMRLFVAVNLPPDVRERLAAVRDRLRNVQADVGWVRVENLHITLKFLGETEEKRLDRIRDVLAEVARGWAPFPLEVAGVGSFGGRVPRVVWAGVSEGADRLTRLAGRVESALSRVGFPKEKRSFSAHLTLGRVRSPKNTEALVVVLSEYHAEKFGTLEATEFQLMQSELRPTGSVYTMLERFPLEARERGETLEERHAG
jgi:2'-5' RNA ligase